MRNTILLKKRFAEIYNDGICIPNAVGTWVALYAVKPVAVCPYFEIIGSTASVTRVVG